MCEKQKPQGYCKSIKESSPDPIGLRENCSKHACRRKVYPALVLLKMTLIQTWLQGQTKKPEGSKRGNHCGRATCAITSMGLRRAWFLATPKKE
jgi:hypothetical protein